MAKIEICLGYNHFIFTLLHIIFIVAILVYIFTLKVVIVFTFQVILSKFWKTGSIIYRIVFFFFIILLWINLLRISYWSSYRWIILSNSNTIKIIFQTFNTLLSTTVLFHITFLRVFPNTWQLIPYTLLLAWCIFIKTIIADIGITV